MPLLSQFFKKVWCKNMEIVIASNNVHKIDEIRDKLRPLLDITVHAMKDRCGSMDIEETGKTFEDNALIKARAVHDFCKMAVLADDSGLVVDFLKGEPGVYSARYGGLSSDQERNMLLLCCLHFSLSSTLISQFCTSFLDW